MTFAQRLSVLSQVITVPQLQNATLIHHIITRDRLLSWPGVSLEGDQTVSRVCLKPELHQLNRFMFGRFTTARRTEEVVVVHNFYKSTFLPLH